MRRAVAAFVILSASALAVHAQPPPRDARSSTSSPTGTGRISGRVVAAETGDPLRNARVVLSPGTTDVPLVLTDAEGRFSFTSLPPGTYFVSAVDRQRASEDNGEWLNPELLESLAPGAASITLSEGQKLAVGARLAAR